MCPRQRRGGAAWGERGWRGGWRLEGQYHKIRWVIWMEHSLTFTLVRMCHTTNIIERGLKHRRARRHFGPDEKKKRRGRGPATGTNSSSTCGNTALTLCDINGENHCRTPLMALNMPHSHDTSKPQVSSLILPGSISGYVVTSTINNNRPGSYVS